jgi:phosphonate metabolism-associated iron-containing alcohol dehydrogenase
LREHRDVRLIVDERLQRRLRVADAHRYLHAGKAPIEPSEHLGHVKGSDRANPQMARLELARVLQQMHGLAFEREDPLRKLEELLAERRQRHLMAAPVEQFGPVVLFEEADLRGDRGLADVQQLRPASKTPGARHGVERPELSQAHGKFLHSKNSFSEWITANKTIGSIVRWRATCRHRSPEPEMGGGEVSFRYQNPVSIRYGAGSIAELPAVLAGRRAVLVTFPEAEDLGLVARIRGLLGTALAGIEDRIEPNPDVSYLAAMHERFWSEHADCETVVAVGGGSAIDTAKALMVGTASGRFDELVALLATGSMFKPHRVKSLIAVPTTSGTGSEVTPWATIWNRADGKKYSLHLPQTWPETAIVDPELMLTLPDSITVQSGLDALSHALESIWNVNANPISDIFAVAAAREVIATLPALLDKPMDAPLRAQMALAALKAGLAFSNTKTALAHSISYEMTLRFGLPHGIACSFTLRWCSSARSVSMPGATPCWQPSSTAIWPRRRAGSRRSWKAWASKATSAHMASAKKIRAGWWLRRWKAFAAATS